jgi:hypothetical protein
MAAEDQIGSIVNRRALPTILLVLSVLLVLLSFAVGWYSVDTTLRRWEYDQSNPPDYDGASLGVPFELDLEMRMLSIDTYSAPDQLRRNIEERGGEPNYDEHAGRMGTVMLGMLMMQLVILLCLIALAGFYSLHKKGRTSLGPTVKRLSVVFIVLMFLSLLYFAVRIGPAAREDEQFILSRYSFDDSVAYESLEPELGFWRIWTSDKRTINVPNQGLQVWQFTVESKPSAGWWLSLAALGCVVGARIVAQRNGEFDVDAMKDAPQYPKPAYG